MKHSIRPAAAALLSAWLSPVALAYDGLDLYNCVISDQDRVSSTGVALTDVRAILAQDRANFHRFKRRDAGDSPDTTFTTAANRRLWQTARLDIDPALANRIVSGGDVDVKVFVFTREWIEVREGRLDPNFL